MLSSSYWADASNLMMDLDSPIAHEHNHDHLGMLVEKPKEDPSLLEA